MAKQNENLDRAVESFRANHFREHWFKSVKADYQRQCLQVHLRTSDGYPSRIANEWEGFEVRLHPPIPPESKQNPVNE